MKEGGVAAGPLVGRLKDYLHYCQVDQDLETPEQVQQVFHDLQSLSRQLDELAYSATLEGLPRLQWPPT
eukprot:564476-Hanusia_phi.AAC.3